MHTHSGKRSGREVGHVTNLCERCWIEKQPSQDALKIRRKLRRQNAKKDAEFHKPSADDYLQEKCAVHRTAREKKMWSRFQVLRQALKTIEDPTKCKEFKANSIRSIASENRLTTTECQLQYQLWPSRQRACNRRRLVKMYVSVSHRSYIYTYICMPIG